MLRTLIILLFILAIFSSAVAIFVFLMKRIGHLLNWNINYKDVKKTIGNVKVSDTLVLTIGYEDLHPKNTKVKYTSEVGFQYLVRVVSDGIIVHSINSASYGIKKSDISEIVVKKLVGGRGTWLLNYRISIYVYKGIKDVFHIITTDRIIDSLNEIMDGEIKIVT